MSLKSGFICDVFGRNGWFKAEVFDEVSGSFILDLIARTE